MTLRLMSCGCELFKEELILARKNNSNPRLRCPEHLGEVVNRINYCLDCDIELIFKPTGPMQIRCTPCDDNHHLKDCREKYRPAAKKRKKKLKKKKKLHKNVPIVEKQKGYFTQPVNVHSLSEAIKLGVACIPSEKLFRFNQKLEREFFNEQEEFS